jgi:hypothetical protein
MSKSKRNTGFMQTRPDMGEMGFDPISAAARAVVGELEGPTVSQELLDTLAYIETDERFTRDSIYESLFGKKD